MVISPFFENTGSAPVCIAGKQPVPYVFFTSLPQSSTAQTARSAGPRGSRHRDLSTEQLHVRFAVYAARGLHLRQHLFRYTKRAPTSASQHRRRMSNSIVREAFVTSVTCALPPGQLPDQPGVYRAEKAVLPPRPSAAPQAHCPGSSAASFRKNMHLAPGPSFHIRSDQPAATGASAMGAVRLHCHTIAGQTGSPVALSQPPWSHAGSLCLWRQCPPPSAPPAAWPFLRPRESYPRSQPRRAPPSRASGSAGGIPSAPPSALRQRGRRLCIWNSSSLVEGP